MQCIRQVNRYFHYTPPTENCHSSIDKLTRVNIYYHHKICKLSVRTVQKCVLGFIGNNPWKFFNISRSLLLTCVFLCFEQGNDFLFLVSVVASRRSAPIHSIKYFNNNNSNKHRDYMKDSVLRHLAFLIPRLSHQFLARKTPYLAPLYAFYILAQVLLRSPLSYHDI